MFRAAKVASVLVYEAQLGDLEAEIQETAEAQFPRPDSETEAGWKDEWEGEKLKGVDGDEQGEVEKEEKEDEEDEERDEPEELDLSRYAPPEALTKLPEEAEEAIILVVQSSIENIQQQVKAEKQRADEAATAAAAAAEEAEAARRAEKEAAAQQGKGKGRAEYPDDQVIEHGKTSSDSIPRIEINGEASASTTIRQLKRDEEAGRPAKRHRFGFRRIFGIDKGSDTRGESSTTGAKAAAKQAYYDLYHERQSQARAVRLGWSKGYSPAAMPVVAAAAAAFAGPGPITQLIYDNIKPTTAEAEAAAAAETVECVSCLEDISPKDGVKTVCHYYCAECFERLIEVTLTSEAQWPPKCCLNPIPFRTIARHVGDELLQQYKDKDEEYKVPVENRIYCSEPDCGEWVRKVDQARKTARCSKGHTMCLLCRGAPHDTAEACPQDRDRLLTDQLAEEEGWRRCIRCSVLVEHREACQHMTCRCGAEFCYVCGAVWCTCACNIAMLNEIKQRAAQRRQVREEAQAAEDAWLAKALELIANLEREERRKAAEARAAEEAERLRREEVRLAALEPKYKGLRISLAELELFQRISLFSAQDSELVACTAGAAEERAALTQKHESERAELRAATAADIRSRELEWEKDYCVRAAWEKQLEQEYAAALRTFWADKVGGHVRLEQAMRDYMRKNDGRMDAWRRWKSDELERFRYVAEDELAVREELMDAASERQAEKLAARETELIRRHMAERKWYDLVVAERERLLAEMEVVERETGGEALLGNGCELDLDLDEYDYENPRATDEELEQQNGLSDERWFVEC